MKSEPADTEIIQLGHGGGGRLSRELIDREIVPRFGDGPLKGLPDGATLPPLEGSLAFSTDSYVVQPLEFPGGNIGHLAVHGTVNDLAVAGASPRYLSLNAFIEEGLEIAVLERIVASLGAAARQAGVQVVAGDTKVLPRGEGGGLYLATTGVGLRPAGVDLGMHRIRPGDAIAVSGPIGDHGIAVLLAREEFEISGNVRSDCGNVIALAQAAMQLDGLRFMRDPTRGGLATVAHEIAHASGLEVRLDGPAIPVRDAVESVCEILGFEPLFLACEGRVVAVARPDAAEQILAAWRAQPEGEAAALIGEVAAGRARVTLTTELGGTRMLEELEDDPLPRIC